MTRAEIVDKYIKRNHLRLYKGDPGDLFVLLPFFLMDAGYQYYSKHILPNKSFTQMLQHYRSLWGETYGNFNKRYTTSYTVEEREEANAFMDSFQNSITNDLMNVQIAAMRCFEKDFSFEQQQIISSAIMFNKLAFISQAYWRRMYQKSSMEIRSTIKWSYEFCYKYMAQIGKDESAITSSQIADIDKCANILCTKIIDRIKELNSEEDGLRGIIPATVV